MAVNVQSYIVHLGFVRDSSELVLGVLNRSSPGKVMF